MSAIFKAARMLGWASFAVGATELFATHWLEDTMGIDDHEVLIRAYGVRECASGAMILAEPGITSKLAAGLWSRVIGDALDIATLMVVAPESRRPSGWATVMTLVLGITGMDLFVSARVQTELRHQRLASEAARHRVQRKPAVPVQPPQKAPVGV